MKGAISLLLLGVVIGGRGDDAELSLAQPCDLEACQLPDCRCSTTDIPGGLEPRDTPQFFMLTFDDSINVINIETYRQNLYNRTQISNGCQVGTTYYINHEYTDYTLVNELYNNGFEIALHSITHQTPSTYWAQAPYETIKQEFADQKPQMAHFANIPIDHIKGVRLPFLQLPGNASFQIKPEAELLYDCTWGTQDSLDPGLWPYTLDYASTQDCHIPPCPTASIPGTWEIPLVSWLDLEGVTCVLVDTCYYVPDLDDEDGWFNLIATNFERHYLGNRAPFGFFVHEWYIRTNPAIERALVRFIDTVTKIHDVFMVNSQDVIDWVRHPVPINEYKERACRVPETAPCNRRSCGPLPASHNGLDYWMTSCAECPQVYPWIGNPFGLESQNVY